MTLQLHFTVPIVNFLLVFSFHFFFVFEFLLFLFLKPIFLSGNSHAKTEVLESNQLTGHVLDEISSILVA